MGELKNLTYYAKPDTPLYLEEINVLLEVIRGNANKGTLIIDCQENGEAAKCLVRCALSGSGAFRSGKKISDAIADGALVYPIAKKSRSDGASPRIFYRSEKKISDAMAEQAINGTLVYPRTKESRYSHLPTSDDPFDTEAGIYQDGGFMVLVLPATDGRFLATFYTVPESGGNEGGTMLLLTIAETFARLDEDDKALRDSADKIIAMVDGGDTVVRKIGEMFDNSPIIEKWREWHRSVSRFGELIRFFGQKEVLRMDYEKMWEELKERIVADKAYHESGAMQSMAEAAHGAAKCGEILSWMEEMERKYTSS